MTEFIELVKQMRAAQKRWAKEPSQAALIESKLLERKVDRALERQRDAPQPEPQEDEVPW